MLAEDLLDYVREDVAATSALAGAALESSTATRCDSRRTGPTPCKLSALPTSGDRDSPAAGASEDSDAKLAQSMGAFDDLGSRSGTATSRFR